MTDRDCPAPLICHTGTSTCETSCTGCGGDDAAVADTSPPDAAVAGCWQAWLDGTVALRPPTRVEQLRVPNTNSQNSSLSFDGLTIYLNRSGDPFRATRSALDAAFGAAQPVTEFETTAEDSRISTNADHTLAVFASSRMGTLGQLDLWQATRASPMVPFGSITAAPFIEINDANQQFDPEITPDGLHLYWSPSIGGEQLLHHASRASIDDAFDTGITLAIAMGQLTDIYDPSISPDQRVILFAGQIGAGSGDLFYATRASPTGTFSAATELPGINTTSHEGDVDISADGCTLFFASNRMTGTDIWTSEVER